MIAGIEKFLGISVDKITLALLETIYMVSFSLIIGTCIALGIAIVLVLYRKGGLYNKPIVYNLLNILINIIRSTPFVVLLIAIMPLTKVLVGTRIGPTAAIVPLTCYIIPFMARLMENSLLDTGKGIMEAAQAMGASTTQIIVHFMLPEAKGSLILSITTGIVGLIGSSAMAGYIGGGGIGSLVLNYGYNRFNFELMYTLVVVLILVTQVIQSIGSQLATRARK